MRFARFMLAVSTTVVLAGCGQKQAGTTPPESSSTTTPPPAAAPESAAAPALLEKSLYDDGPRASAGPVNAAGATEGEKLFTSKGCVACHGWGKKLTGPDLKGVTGRRTALWMEHQILHPEVMIKQDPISHELFTQYKIPMTNQGLTQAQAQQVIEYLKKRDKAGS